MNNLKELKAVALAVKAGNSFTAAQVFEITFTVDCILALIAQLEAAQKERGVYAAISEDVGAIVTLLQGNEWAEHAAKTKVGGVLEHEITRLISSIADLRDRAEKAEAELSAANQKHGWIKCRDQMPNPNQKLRVCVFTPNDASDLRYRLVPASLFKAVCSSATHWHYVNDPVEGE
ncbi:DUF551 domain-containing protein [Yersinia proxima]|uniref:DUF551 domain-containing protein n=1 Tax=Yersinia proxima TaxID=2890316 RepID=UPI001D11792A|nr:DUF551 domain-containing protein [Yersinia proxima]